MKDIKSYIHLYIGCRAKTTGGKYGKIVSASVDGTAIIVYDNEDPRGFVISIAALKLILRPLESMTPKEITEYYEWPPRYEITKFSVEHYGIKIAYKYPDWITPGEWMHSESFFHFNDIRRADKFLWLLSKGFDLFDLKDAGLAVYETDVKS